PSPWINGLIRLYYVLAAVSVALGIEDTLRPSTPVRGWFPAYVVAFLAALGLPLLLISAATALVEERARGSLDVLLTTPLSSRSIVLSKWWGVSRQTPRFLIIPAPLVAALVWDAGNPEMAAVLLLFLIASAAAWTSVGLALSTWIPRVSRAVSVAVV